MAEVQGKKYDDETVLPGYYSDQNRLNADIEALKEIKESLGLNVFSGLNQFADATESEINRASGSLESSQKQLKSILFLLGIDSSLTSLDMACMDGMTLDELNTLIYESGNITESDTRCRGQIAYIFGYCTNPEAIESYMNSKELISGLSEHENMLKGVARQIENTLGSTSVNSFVHQVLKAL